MRIFLEAAEMRSVGGWTVDTQSLETLGAAYLLAHGIGRPVADAETGFSVSRAGRWRVWAHTRDWTAVWGRGTPAGRFRLAVDAKELPETLGTAGEAWAWQYAGVVDLAAGEHRIALRDLTGFDGRVSAVFLSDDPAETPPEGAALREFRERRRRTVDDPAEYDLIVCGGGYAGLCTALAAKDSGLKILVVQDRPVPGGCGSSEVRVWTGGMVGLGEYPRLGAIAGAVSPLYGSPGDPKKAEYFEDHRKAAAFAPGELLLNEAAIAVETAPGDPRRIAAVLTLSVRTGVVTRRRGKLFSDCTGDALLARRTGCEIMYGCEGRARFREALAPEEDQAMVMGHSTLWETRELAHPTEFPDIDWGIEFHSGNALARLNCCWDWETGQFRDQIRDIEFIRDYGLMSCYANWSFWKNRSPERAKWANMDLEWVSAIGGKRESCRVVGDLILTQNDIEEQVHYPDGTGCATWSLDLHYPDPENRRIFGEAFQSCAYHLGLKAPYPVPYRCLYARDMDNLFLGGRILSVSHVAFSCIRVMRTLGMLGEAAGMAAAICVRHGVGPREVYRRYLDDLKSAMRRGVTVPLPNAHYPRRAEAYHFMRPVGQCGNDTEDCWVNFDENGRPEHPVPEPLKRDIRELGLTHRDGRKFHDDGGSPAE